MKIRKTIAFLTAVAMLAALVPAMALTASAADVTAIILSDGKTAYRLSGSNLIADGSFETDAWESQLTTGKLHGMNGISSTSVMNENPSGVWVRSSEAKTGTYSLALAKDKQGTASISEANKPASIKHYIQNTSGATQKYYVSFYAKSAVDGDAAFCFAAESVNHIDGISVSKDITVGSDWTFVEAVVDVAAENYLRISVYNIVADTLYLDDFAVYAVYADNDTKAFSSAMSNWRFTYKDGDVISSDMTLPTSKSSNLTMVWSSDHPELISETGKFTAPVDDTAVALTASFALNGTDFYAERSFRFVAKGFREDLNAAVTGIVPRIASGDLELPATIEGFSGSEVTWKSSDTEIITDDGKYTAPENQGTVVITATVSYNNEVVDFEIPVIVGVTPSLIYNSGFDLNDDGVITGWTVGVDGVDRRSGGTAPMTTANFDYVEDETGNKYIVSKNHHGLSSPDSIRTYIDLEPGKVYNLSFKMWYQGSEKSYESYTGAYLVDSTGAAITNAAVANARKAATGGFIPDAGDQLIGVSKADGWQTVETVLKPTRTYSTLLIAASWLNANGTWAFDDFVLQEVPIEFYGDVTINYRDRETNELIKSSKVVTNQIGNMKYTVEAAEKENIVVGTGDDAITYAYDVSSIDSVIVANPKGSGENNEIDLYFMKQVPTDVTVKFLDRATDSPIKAEETMVGYIGFTAEATTAQKANISGENNYLYTYDSSSTDTVNVTENGDNTIILYFNQVLNLITNGNFATGDTTGWTNRMGGAITGATISYDRELGCNVLSMATGGRTATNNIGTAWSVTPGKTYYLSFYVGGDKPTEANYTYNRVSESYNETDGVRENAGTDLITFGADMTANQWNHMELTFTAKTDTVYIQSSWMDNIKFGNFVMYEVTGDYKASVTINYLDRATGRKLKDPTVVSGVNGYNDGSATYTANDTDKADITVDGVTYVYDTTSTDSTTVKKSGNVINLYFNELKVSSVEEPSVDILASDEVTLPETVTVTYSDGTEKNKAVTWDAVPDGLEEGKTYVVNGTLEDGLTTTASVKVFYTIKKGSDNEEDYNWVEVDGTNYPIAKDAENIIPNGDFTDGTTGWTNAANGGSLSSNWSVDSTSGYAKSGNSIHTSNGNVGGASDGTIRTFFKVEAGKSYYAAYRVYNAGTAATANQGNSGMRALVGTEGSGYGNPQTCGASLYGISDYGGFSSWTANATSSTDFPTIGTMPGRDDGTHAVGANDYATVINMPSTATNPYIMISLGAWSGETNYLYYSDFEIYEIADFGTSMASKIVINVNGVDADSVLVDKDADIPDFSVDYPDCVIDTAGVDTSVPNAGTVYITDPTKVSTLTFSGNKAVLKAVGESISGVLVVAQYNSDGELVDVVSTPVEITDGESAELAFSASGSAAVVKAMVIESMSNIKPLIRAVSKDI